MKLKGVLFHIKRCTYSDPPAHVCGEKWVWFLVAWNGNFLAAHSLYCCTTWFR